MARKISQHTELAELDYHNDDLVEVVDVSDTTDAASGTNKKTKWSTIKATLKTYFDTIYSTFSGSYDDLTDKPTLGSAAAADAGDFEAAGAVSALAGTLGAVATSNDYGDLDNTPDLSNLPSADEKAALAGTNGAASGTNKYVTNSDSRNTDSRTPTSHASSHTDGTDDIQDATVSQKGLATATQITKLDGIATGADVTNASTVGAATAGATAKTTPVDADTIPLNDSADSNALKKVSWTNIKATLKTYLDTLYVALSGNQTIAGVKTFSSFPVTPSSPPSTDYEVANKKFVLDNAGGGGGAGRKFRALSSAFATSSTTGVEVTGLSLTLESGKTYSFSFTGRVVANSSTEAPRFGISGPTKSNLIGKYILITTSVASTNTGFIDYMDQFLSSPASGNASEGLYFEVLGFITTTAAGSLKLLLSTETGGANSNEIAIGATATFQELTAP